MHIILLLVNTIIIICNLSILSVSSYRYQMYSWDEKIRDEINRVAKEKDISQAKDIIANLQRVSDFVYITNWFNTFCIMLNVILIILFFPYIWYNYFLEK